MFQNLSIFRIAEGFNADLATIETALQAAKFAPCSPSQDKAVGWVPPRGEEHGALVESVAGQWIARLQIETKSVPGSEVKKKAQEAADHIEATTGRKPGRKETKELREDAKQALLPAAFPRTAGIWVWINKETRTLVLDASSQGKVDEVVTALVRSLDGLALTYVQTNMTPQTAMTQWLATTDPQNDLPGEFAVERACDLKSADEEKALVRFKNHYLHTDEVRKHLNEGKLPTSLAMSWAGRVGFTLTEGMTLKGIKFLEGVFDDRSGDDESGFDTDVALATGELSKMIPELIEALGGEAEHGAALPGATGAPTIYTDGQPDPLLEQARALVIAEGKASISYVQRKLAIGYSRAARLIEDLESMGVVGPMLASGQREVRK